MLLKYFYDEGLAQASYLIGCAATQEALVIDPARGIQAYLDMADKEGLHITHVTETHIHADFVSGSRELAAATGAMIYLSDEGDADWKYQYADQENVTLVRDGDHFMVGNVQITVLHTPGHTPEHICFMITDTASADQAMGVFTGDFIFVGNVGRPDLLEEAAGIQGSKEIGAQQMFHSLRKIQSLPDYLQILPGHGAGSACGKGLGSVPSTTLGYERLFNPAFQLDDEAAFSQWLLSDQPEAPYYFAQMKQVNKQGPVLTATLSPLTQLAPSQLEEARADNALLFDLRDQAAFADGHIPDSINIPMNSRTYINYIGWLIDYDQKPYFVVPDGANIDQIQADLRSIGVDNVAGYFIAETILSSENAVIDQVQTQDIVNRLATDDLILLDVRAKTEYADGHIAGAINMPLGYLVNDATHQLDPDKPIVVYCASGYRSSIGASVLKRLGYQRVMNLVDGKAIWSQELATD